MHGNTDGILSGRGIEMQRIAIPDYLIHLRGLAAAAFLLLGNNALHAADDCLSKPRRGETHGGHWYYQTNPATHHKCWYVARPATGRASADKTAAQAAPSSAPAPLSAVQQLVNVLTGNRQKNDQPPPIAEPPPARGVKAAKQSPHATRRVNRVTAHSTTLDETQRDALFRDFLQWEAQKKDRATE
jgi:hypothetical protein